MVSYLYCDPLVVGACFEKWITISLHAALGDAYVVRQPYVDLLMLYHLPPYSFREAEIPDKRGTSTTNHPGNAKCECGIPSCIDTAAHYVFGAERSYDLVNFWPLAYAISADVERHRFRCSLETNSLFSSKTISAFRFSALKARRAS